MNSIFYSVITLLLLTCGVLLLMRSANKNRYAEDVNAQRQPEMLSKEEGEDHFSALMNSITPYGIGESITNILILSTPQSRG